MGDTGEKPQPTDVKTGSIFPAGPKEKASWQSGAEKYYKLITNLT